MFGLLDLVAAIMMLLVRWNIGKTLGLIMALYVVVKSLVFIKDMASVVDLLAGIFFVLALFDYYNIITYILVLWLLQKGVVSLVFS